QLGVQAVAVSFLHSYVNGEDEDLVVEHLRKALGKGTFLLASHDVVPEAREYERTSTALIAAYLGPRTRAYLSDLTRQLRHDGYPDRLLVMKSNGGLTAVPYAVGHPEELVESGPAAGVVGAARACKSLGI